jgi:hypothetical protein
MKEFYFGLLDFLVQEKLKYQKKFTHKLKKIIKKGIKKIKFKYILMATAYF